MLYDKNFMYKLKYIKFYNTKLTNYYRNTNIKLFNNKNNSFL